MFYVYSMYIVSTLCTYIFGNIEWKETQISLK